MPACISTRSPPASDIPGIAPALFPVRPQGAFGNGLVDPRKPLPPLLPTGADPAPIASQGDAAEQVGGDLQPIEPRHIARGIAAYEAKDLSHTPESATLAAPCPMIYPNPSGRIDSSV